jgi:hypothetical protein
MNVINARLNMENDEREERDEVAVEEDDKSR